VILLSNHFYSVFQRQQQPELPTAGLAIFPIQYLYRNMSATRIHALHIRDPYSCLSFSFIQDFLTQCEVSPLIQFQVPTKGLYPRGFSRAVSITLFLPAFRSLAHHTSPFDALHQHL